MGIDKGSATHVALPGLRTPAVGLDAPFEMLVACHERVHRSLDLLRRLQQHLLEYGPSAETVQASGDVLRYFDLAAPLHHQDEELHVFPALLRGVDKGLHVVVQRLQQDHRNMEVRWAAARVVLLAIAAPPVSPGAPLNREQTTTLNDFAILYEQHIVDEEALVYPAAQAALGAAEVAAMSADMAQRRGVR
jgi:hemerythrin-like domain-containing protein